MPHSVLVHSLLNMVSEYTFAVVADVHILFGDAYSD